MKIITFIFLFYLFTASVFPCADVFESFKDNKEVHTEQSAQSNTDGCAFFCICNCCGTVLTTSDTTGNVDAPYTDPTTFVSYSEHPISALSYSVWQPPKRV